MRLLLHVANPTARDAAARRVNRFTVRASRRNQRTANELPLTIEDAVSEIGYEGTRHGGFPAHGTTADVPSLRLPVS